MLSALTVTRFTFQNNRYNSENRYYGELVELMTRRDPFYEQPLLEEDRSNATAQTVSN